MCACSINDSALIPRRVSEFAGPPTLPMAVCSPHMRLLLPITVGKLLETQSDGRYVGHSINSDDKSAADRALYEKFSGKCKISASTHPDGLRQLVAVKRHDSAPFTQRVIRIAR
jgi:hypothetical protein